VEEDYKAFNDVVAVIPSPFADPAVIPTFQCVKRISDEVDVVLDGTGADTLIGIMPAKHIRFILRYSCHIPYWLRSFLLELLQFNKKLSTYTALFEFEDVEELLIRWKGWTRDEISRLCNQQCSLSHTRFYKLFSEHSDKEPYELYSLLIGALPDDRIHQTFALLEKKVAFPFFDRSVQEFVRRLPLRYKYGNGTSKVLFREALGEVLPSNIWDKPKHGFDYPFENLLRYKNNELPKTLLSKNAVDIHRLFDFTVIEQYLHRFLSGDDTVKFKIWALIVFQAWYLRHYKA
jgi:asparagine synthase (glutamine-hydrolysing)